MYCHPHENTCKENIKNGKEEGKVRKAEYDQYQKMFFDEIVFYYIIGFTCSLNFNVVLYCSLPRHGESAHKL